MLAAKNDRRRRGSVLFVALATVIAIAGLSMCLLQLNSSMTRQQVVSVDNKRALYIAEAGLSEAYYGLRTGRTGNVGTRDMPARFGDGLFWVEAEDLGDGQTTLQSTGMCGSGRFALSITVERQGESIGALGLFGDDELRIDPGVHVDGWDSRLGPYEPSDAAGGALLAVDGAAPTPEHPCRLGANGDVVVSGTRAAPTFVGGDVTPGPGGSVLADRATVIAGSTTPRDAEIALAPVEVPSVPDRGDLVVNGPGAHRLPPAESGYSSVIVAGGATLVVEGPARVVADRVHVEGGSSLVLDATSGEVELYALEQLLLDEGVSFSTASQDPQAVSVFALGDEDEDLDGDGRADVAVRLAAMGSFYGVLYAPSATLRLPGSFELFGAAAARSLHLGSGARVHFDAALASAGAAGTGARPRLVSWRVVDLPTARIVSVRTDPVTALGLQDVVLPDGAEAHDEDLWKIRYRDSSGRVRTYVGHQDGFTDWTNVDVTLFQGNPGDAGFDAD